MIDRYSLPEMAGLWTDRARMETWLEVELLAAEAQGDADVRAHAPTVDEEFVQEVFDRERTTDHDVAAFVDVVQQRMGRAGQRIHYGLTSSDVVDTALSVVLKRSAALLIKELSSLIDTLGEQARAHKDTAMVGRTHGIHAEPTTFGAKLALWALQADRDRTRLANAKETISVGKLSGAVGTYSNIDPAVEAQVCTALGLTPVPATQVISRDRHAEFVYACAAIGSTLELIGTEIRHLQRTEVGEVSEPFSQGQKGSSAMPHKRNPIKSEGLTGQARLLRGYLIPALEDVALWHERDISHSSVERIVLPDVSILTHYMLVRARKLIKDLNVDTDRMRENFELSYGLVFSQPVLLALIGSGQTRDDAYRIVQRNAQKAWGDRKPFRTVLEEDPDVRLDHAQLDAAFDMRRALTNAHRTIDALEDIE